MTDNELAIAIKQHLAESPYASRTDIKKEFNTSLKRLFRLEGEGLIQLPKPMSRSAAATLNRKRTNLCGSWYINKPAPWQMGVKS